MSLKILVGCEESQEVTMALRSLGHEAYSCDIQACSGGHPEWHICEDVLPLLNGNKRFTTEDGATHRIKGKWDMIIAFPPCTHLAVSGARHFDKKRLDGRQRQAVWFFCQFLTADCDRIAIENPVGIMSGDYVRKFFPDLADQYGLPIAWTQQIQPYEFGEPHKKTTCLWLKNLPTLEPTEVVEPNMVEYVCSDGKVARFSEFLVRGIEGDRSVARSKTFPKVAEQMARQWTSESALNYKCGWYTPSTKKTSCIFDDEPNFFDLLGI